MSSLTRIPHDSYSGLSRALHWLTLVLLIGLFALGWSFDSFEGPVKGQMVAIHKSLGITVLTLTVLRIAYRVVARVPALPAGVPRWQAVIARATQYLLYALLVAEPLLGWGGSSAAGRPVAYFGLFTLPSLVGADRPLARQLFGLHETVSTVLAILIGLHAAAALWHHYVRRDDVLLSMLRSAPTAE